MGEAYSAAYTAAKHGLVGLTKALAIEYLNTPLRVNCVCPGGMDTPQAHTIGVPDGADWDLIMRVSAKRGFLSADDVAAVVAFLASDDATACTAASRSSTWATPRADGTAGSGQRLMRSRGATAARRRCRGRGRG